MATTGSWSDGAGLSAAPPPFVWQGKTVVPVRFARYDLTLDIDPARQRASGEARIRFYAPQRGCPLLDMVPQPSRIEVDGRPLDLSRFPEVVPPDQQAMVRVLDVEVREGTEHELAISYALTDRTVHFDDGGVQLAFFMSDLDERGYLEYHAPSNLEFDQFPLSIVIRLAGPTQPHLFTNGTAARTADGWTIDFPSYFSASSFFLHLSDRDFKISEGTHQGLAGTIPILAYGTRTNDVARAVQKAKRILADLERDYGAYAHERLTIYVTRGLDDGQGGMEYCGATMTGVPALDHELFHSWFARGVMPGNGNSGWIDEGLAQWRDLGYPSRRATGKRAPVNLAAFSPYCRHTADASYEYGGKLFAELDHLFGGDGAGLRPVLRALYEQRKRQQITTEFFRSFLEQHSGHDLGEMFDRFVYGRPSAFKGFPDEFGRRMAADRAVKAFVAKAPPRPRAFTREELRALR